MPNPTTTSKNSKVMQDPMQEALAQAANADEAVVTAETRLEEARLKAEAAAHNIPRAEAEAVKAMVDAGVAGDSIDSRTQIDTARRRLEKARSDAEWARLEVHAAEVGYSRAADAAGHAHRRLVAEEYRAAHRSYNDPKSRENVLMARLTETVAELFQLGHSRRELHSRLASAYASFPPDEKIADIPPGLPITTHTYGHGHHHVALPYEDMAEAVKEGIAIASAALSLPH